MERIIEVPEDLIKEAIIRRSAAVAATTGRHREWVSRRLKEAIDFVSTHTASDKEFMMHWNLAEPVFVEAAVIARRKLSDFKVGSVH